MRRECKDDGAPEALFECVTEIYQGFSLEMINKTVNSYIDAADSPKQKSKKFLVIMLTAFLARVRPHSKRANPACIKKTRIAQINNQRISAVDWGKEGAASA